MSEGDNDGYSVRRPKPSITPDEIEDFIQKGTRTKSERNDVSADARSEEPSEEPTTPNRAPTDTPTKASASPSPNATSDTTTPSSSSTRQDYADGSVKHRYSFRIDVDLFQSVRVFAALNDVSIREAMELLLREALSFHDEVP